MEFYNYWNSTVFNESQISSFYHSHSKYGLETQLKSLFYLFVHLYADLCMVHVTEHI